MIESRPKAIIVLICLAMTFAGCEKETGACESKFQNYQGYTLYTCDENVDSDMCEGGSEHFWQDKSCINLGYNYYNEGNESWQIDENNNGIPGAFGYWGDGSASGTGGSTGSCGVSGYNGPEFDIQVDSQCKTAYYYDCIGNTDGVKAACAIYKQWQQDDSSIPDCPYCD